MNTSISSMKLQFNKTYILIAVILMAIELAIAFFIKTGCIRHTFGDYLVVMLLYAIMRGCTNLRVWVSALVVLIIAFSIEFLQLTPVLSYLNLQDSFTAKLILGSTFEILDLWAYTAGVCTILALEALINAIKTSTS